MKSVLQNVLLQNLHQSSKICQGTHRLFTTQQFISPKTCCQDLLRLIEIEGVDINPCGGTHLSCTSELQVLKVVGLEKSRGLARLRFMVGGRVIAALGASLKREAALNKV